MTSDSRFTLGSAYRPAVEKRTLADRGGKALVQRRVENGPDQQFAMMLQGQRYRIMGDAMHEIGRSVQRIDDPAVLGLAGGVAGKLIFLAEHGMVRKCLQNGRFDDFLGGKIGLGDEVGRPFVLDAGLANPAPDRRPGRPNGFFTGLKIGLEFRS